MSNYSLFISFSAVDREWVEKFLIPEIGLPPESLITTQSFTPGAYTIEEFERAVINSSCSLLIFTPAYLNDTVNRLGEKFASFLNAEEQARRLIPLILKDCELPLRIKALVQLDYRETSRWPQETSRLRAIIGQPEPPKRIIPSPYPGLQPYSQEDAAFFFGREEELHLLCSHLERQNFAVLIGPSGCGKSSFISAGLIPALRQKQPERWIIKLFRPGMYPYTGLCQALGGQIDLETGLPEYPAGQRLLLILDQFEELFFLASEEERRKAAALINMLRSASSCVTVLVLRSDFYGDLQASALWPVSSEQRFDLIPLSGEALRRAVRMPAEMLGVFLETSLIERLIAEIAGEHGALPLVQETLLQLWEKRIGNFIPLSIYQNLGGLSEAIARKAEAVFNRLDKRQQLSARRIFIRLVQFGEGRGDTRRQQTIDALAAAEEDQGLCREVIRILADHRLLTISGEEDGQPKADLVHEALIIGWPRFHDWVTEYRKAETIRRRFAARAEEWANSGRAGGLLDDIQLAQALKWLASPSAQDVGIDDLVKAFILESQRAQQAGRVKRWLMPALLTIGLLALGFAGWQGYRSWLRARAASLNPPVSIPSGAFTLGDSNSHFTGVRNAQAIHVPGFELDRYEVTNEQYCLCTKFGQGGCSGRPAYSQRDVCSHDADFSRLPVTQVSIGQAAQFCRWLNRRLPTEIEWEWAAKGPGANPFPTGPELPDGANILTSQAPWPVDQMPADRLPGLPVYGMAGNVSEWTLSIFLEYDDPNYLSSHWTESMGPMEGYIVARGGDFAHGPDFARSIYRQPVRPGEYLDTIGFRCLTGLPIQAFVEEVKKEKTSSPAQ